MTAADIALYTNVSHWVAGTLLGLALLSFLILFLWPAWRTGRQLNGATKALESLKQQPGATLDLKAVANKVMSTRTLQHCWDEFSDTLHPQHGINSSGERVVSRWRATALASSFFSTETLVDTPLRTEFFKHLPGILTGIGIIGTFTGLILGLYGFNPDPSVPTNDIQAGVRTLLRAVMGAFVVSGAAIATAMVVTAIEKALVTRRYADVERLCGQIDGLYDSGAGEEYLARLVEASETSATQAQHIKDALVSDLKGILTELTERQLSTLTTSNLQLGQQISSAVTDTLKAPLENISDAVKQVAGQQGDAVNKLLTDVLASFAERMEAMFGGQLGGMNDLLKQTALTMQGTAQQFEALAARIEQAGTGATDKMASRMDELMTTFSERQAENNAQMAAFVEQMRKMVADGTSQNAELLQGTFTELSQVTAQLVQQLQGQTSAASRELQGHAQATAAQMQEALKEQQALMQAMSAQHSDRLQGAFSDLSATTGQLAADLKQQTAATSSELLSRVEALAGHFDSTLERQQAQMQALAQAVQGAATSMQDAITRVRSGVDDNITRMSGAAERLDGAAGKLTTSLQAMSTAADAVDKGIDQLSGAAQALNLAVNANNQALGQHKEVRDAVTSMVAELRKSIETMSRDAAVNDRLVKQMETAADRLVGAQHEAEKYLEGVTETLGAAHEAFANTVSSTLQRGNADFQQELGRAVDMLRTGIQDLGDLLDNLPATARR